MFKALVWMAAIFGAASAKTTTNISDPHPVFTNINVTYVATMPNTRHPELVYWFWTNETLKDQRYLQEIRKLAESSPFNFLMMSDRTVGQGCVFHDVARMHDIFSKVVTEAHARGFKPKVQDLRAESARGIILRAP